MQLPSPALLFSDRSAVSKSAGSLLSLLVRGTFASVLLPFFFTSFLTKVDGFSLTIGAYAQIVPKQIEALGYDSSALSWPLHLLVLAGTLAELVLPLAVVAGLATRVSALAMIGFVGVMSLTDIYGHGIDAQTIGALFDGDPYAVIADQRLLWVIMLVVLMATGGGTFSLDAVVSRWLRRSSDA
jgi:putative oxidoreductase